MGVKSTDDYLTCQCVDHVDSETGRRGETGDCCLLSKKMRQDFKSKAQKGYMELEACFNLEGLLAPSAAIGMTARLLVVAFRDTDGAPLQIL